jgi:glycosyltransferase involved in cell wall biosynthesis
VVAVDVAALKELCHDGENGYLFARDDYRGLAEGVRKIVTNKALSKQFSTESINIVQQNHGTQVTFDQYETVLHRATTDGASS